MTSDPPILADKRSPRKHVLRWLRRLVICGIVLVLAVVALNVWMTGRSGGRIATETAEVPKSDVALVLGTGKYFGGGINLHFTIRMNAAAALYKAGRVKHLLLSGDNSSDEYNEPEDMKAALVERGVPAAAMTCDYAGLRTLDSVVRAKEIFGLHRLIIISDDFHLARALWLADRNDIEATAFYSESVPWSSSWRPRCREWLARVKAVADEVVGTEPKFGGEKIALPGITSTDAGR
ncbi:MAG TPA: ElyC/SanA/YdcF family protein [Verrucomicrobiales bacterium]|nr:ElyC/SanA/YdcF family protein [Verrucomicrobiales bacterium]